MLKSMLKKNRKYLLLAGILLIGVVCIALFSPTADDYVKVSLEEGKEIKGNLLLEPLIFQGEQCKITFYQVVAYEQYIYVAYTLDTKKEEKDYRIETDIALKSGGELPEHTLIIGGDEKKRIAIFAFDSDLKEFLNKPFVFHVWYMDIEDFDESHDFEFTLKDFQETKVCGGEGVFSGVDGFQVKVRDTFLIGNVLLVSYDVEPKPDITKDLLVLYLECIYKGKKIQIGGGGSLGEKYPLQKGRNSTNFLIPLKSIVNPVLIGAQYKMEKPQETIYMEGEYKLQNLG